MKAIVNTKINTKIKGMVPIGALLKLFSATFIGVKSLSKVFGFDVEANTVKSTGASDKLLVLLIGQSNAVRTNIINLSTLEPPYNTYADKIFLKKGNFYGYDSQFRTPQYLIDNVGTGSPQLLAPTESEMYLGGELHRLTGKDIYIVTLAMGGSGFVGTNGTTTQNWLYNGAPYAAHALNSYIQAKTLISNYFELGIVQNMGEEDAKAAASCNAFEANEKALINYFRATLGNLYFIATAFNPESSSIVATTDGATIDVAKQNLLQKLDAANYIGNGYVVKHPYEIESDFTHLTPHSTKLFYSDVANKLLDKIPATEVFQVLNNKSIKVGTQINLDNSYKFLKNKTIWFKFKYETSATDRYLYKTYDNVNGIIVRCPVNGAGLSFYLYQAGVGVTGAVSTIALTSGSNYVFGFSINELATNNLKVFYKKEDKSYPTGASQSWGYTFKTIAENVTLPTIQPFCAWTGSEVYGIYMIDRGQLTDAELLLINYNNDHLIEGVKIMPCDTGFGNTIYDTSGASNILTGAYEWQNASKIPFINLLANREIRKDVSGNYMVVPTSTGAISGFTKVCDCLPNKWYHSLGSSMKLSNVISQLKAKDTDGIFYDVTTGLPKLINKATIDGMTSAYITVDKTDYYINSIKVKK